MKILINHDFNYEIGHLVKIFYKNEKIEFIKNNIKDFYIYNTIDIIDNEASFKATIKNSEKKVETLIKTIQLSNDNFERKRQLKRVNSLLLYDLLSNYTGVKNDWGNLVGIRPVKIVHKLLDENNSYDDIYKKLYDKHRISSKKRKLLIDIAKCERKYIFDNDTNNLSIYICIPFCPSRCLYCSFPSNDLKKKKKQVKPYLESLLLELETAYKNIVKHNRVVDCIYIGGGTPSILSSDEFEILLGRLNEYFNLKDLEEFTIEAGRPDTIDESKLNIFKKYHVDRVCINPQSMNLKTLKIIGRNHSVDDIIEKYNLANKIGFKNINMDLILGLPDEDLEDVKNTLDMIIKLNPTNITIHTLAVKTSSRLKETLELYNMTQEELVREMIELSEKYMKENGYHPYYLYRQKNMVGNFENVGYAKDGHESLYNMRIIEEKNDILALGAGAVSKKCFREEDRFERIANLKGVEEYIHRLSDVLKNTEHFFEI